MQLFYRSKSHSVAKMLPSREDVRSMIDWVHTHSWIYLSVKSSWAVSHPHPALAAYSLGSTHPGDPKPIPIQTWISSNPNPQTQEENPIVHGSSSLSHQTCHQLGHPKISRKSPQISHIWGQPHESKQDKQCKFLRQRSSTLGRCKAWSRSRKYPVILVVRMGKSGRHDAPWKVCFKCSNLRDSQ